MPFADLLGPIKWLVGLWRDRTELYIVGADFKSTLRDTLWVETDSSNKGVCYVAVGTKADSDIEIQEVAVDFGDPLQLTDPEGRGFFSTEMSLDPQLPFRLIWRGRATIKPNAKHVFAIGVRFPPNVEPQRIKLIVDAAKRHKLFGFVASGRVHRTEIVRSLRPATDSLMGIPVEPQTALTSIQPYVIEGAYSAQTTGTGSVVVHELLKDGSASSRRIELQDNRIRPSEPNTR